ncbi:MAG: hypothetical protein CMD97_00125 [Gammaproteobacteria bacterium]|nr:hypothetical protein [Gammaproteobacteria bacterium]
MGKKRKSKKRKSKKRKKRCSVKNCNLFVHVGCRCSMHYRMFLKTKRVNDLKKELDRTKVKLELFNAQWECQICYEKFKTTAFNCGHRTCATCASKVDVCPFCKSEIFLKIKLY